MVSKTCKQLFEDKNWRDEFMFSYITLMRGVLDHDFHWVTIDTAFEHPEVDVRAQCFVLRCAPLVAWAHEQLELSKSTAVSDRDIDYVDPLHPESRVSSVCATFDALVASREGFLADHKISVDKFTAGTPLCEDGAAYWASAFHFDHSLWIRLLAHRQLLRNEPFDATVSEVAVLVANHLGSNAAFSRLLLKIEGLLTRKRKGAEIKVALNGLLEKHLHAVSQSLSADLATNTPQSNGKIEVQGREAGGGFYGDWDLDLNELGLKVQPGPLNKAPEFIEVYLKAIFDEEDREYKVPPRTEFPQVLELVLYSHAATPISRTKMARYVGQLADVVPLVSRMVGDFCDSQYQPNLTLGAHHIDAIRGLWSCLFRHGIVRRLPAEGLAEVREQMKQTANAWNKFTKSRMVGVLEEDYRGERLIPQRDERWSYYLPSDKSGADRLEDRITSASHYLFESYLSPTTPFQLVSAMIACEAIFGNSDKDLSKQISERTSVALEPNKYFRVEAIKSIRALYNLRSRIVHGAQVGITGIDVSVARTIAIGLLLQAISFRQQFKGVHGPNEPGDSKEMFRELDHCKMLGGSPTGAMSWRSVRRIWMTRGQYNDPKNHQQNS